MAVMPKLIVTVTGDFLAHELMRFALKEIVRKHTEDPYGFSGGDASDLAAMALSKADDLEANDGA